MKSCLLIAALAIAATADSNAPDCKSVTPPICPKDHYGNTLCGKGRFITNDPLSDHDYECVFPNGTLSRSPDLSACAVLHAQPTTCETFLLSTSDGLCRLLPTTPTPPGFNGKSEPNFILHCGPSSVKPFEFNADDTLVEFEDPSGVQPGFSVFLYTKQLTYQNGPQALYFHNPNPIRSSRSAGKRELGDDGLLETRDRGHRHPVGNPVQLQWGAI